MYTFHICRSVIRYTPLQDFQSLADFMFTALPPGPSAFQQAALLVQAVK